MDFILNSKTKKVEIFYENAAEQQAILAFMSQYLTYKEDKTTSSIYVNDPGISWTNTTVSTTPFITTANTDLSGIVTLNGGIYGATDSAINTTELKSTITDSIEASLKPKEEKAYAAAKLDNKTSNDDYSCLVAAVPRKTK